jgi:hypothetical protein
MTPVLPGLQMHLWGQHLGWALVLAALAAWLLSRASAPVRRTAIVMAALAALVPGPLGPVYWLALAYQMPSLASIALALWWLRGEVTGQRTRLPTALWASAAALGLLLLLDTLALLPWAVYSKGFSTAAVTLWLVLSALMCTRPNLRGYGWVALVVGSTFAITRLPTGNLWDSLSDPWLFLLALAALLRRVARRNQA